MDLYCSLFYGGFVGDMYGYIGSFIKFVNGIFVFLELEVLIELVFNLFEFNDLLLVVFGMIVLFDDIIYFIFVNIVFNRCVVDFGLVRGSVIVNIVVGNSRWYIELSVISNQFIFFGIVKVGFDVEKEFGVDSSVVVVGMDG